MATLFVYDKKIGGFAAQTPVPPGPAGPFGWSDVRFVSACRELCSIFDLALKSSFRRPGPGRFSAHYAGLAGDFALPPDCRRMSARQNEIRRWCVKSGLFSYVMPQYMTPLWIHAEVSIAPACAPSVPYPQLFPGNMGPHVFILQDRLNALLCRCLMSGRFTADTARALAAFRLKAGLPPGETADDRVWKALFAPTAAARPPLYHSPRL